MLGLDRACWAAIGLGLALACASRAPAQAPSGAQQSGARAALLYHKSRSFRIPFHVEDADRPRLKEVQLWVSEDAGYTWRPASRTTPDRPAFTFRTDHDAEYWFAVRTQDTQGQLYPGDDKAVEPSMRVVVDTTPPSLIVEPLPRQGSRATVRWEVRDEHLDLDSFTLEYQVEGAHEWRQVPVRRKALIGEQTWEAGTADPLKVRASVADKAGNVQQVELALPDGTAANPGPVASEPVEFPSAPPVTPISSSNPASNPGEEAGAAGDADPFADTGQAPAAADAGAAGAADPFAAAGEPPPPASAGRSAPPGGGQTLLVGSPQFALQYAVDDAGPNGPAVVELWATRDGGRTWSRLSEDPDRRSPFPVDLSGLGGEGTFGLSLVARSASGLGDPPPAPGDPPQIWVEVDAAPPVVQLDPPRVGSGAHAGKVAISWRANDAHLAPRPIILAYRPDQPGARWVKIADRIENTGRFVWNVPANVPARFHIRVDALDTLGNRGTADTTEIGPVLIDRTRPRGRIIGLDPSARSGPAARPLR
jgi:hypothetical protein